MGRGILLALKAWFFATWAFIAITCGLLLIEIAGMLTGASEAVCVSLTQVKLAADAMTLVSILSLGLCLATYCLRRLRQHQEPNRHD